MRTVCFFVLVLILMSSTPSHAWGIRGHVSICQAAARLVQNPKLAAWLQDENHHVSYVCDVPDLQWRLMSQNFKEHRLNPENLGYTLSTLPVDYKDIMAQFPEKNKVLGSNWWRAEQFYRRLVDLKNTSMGLTPNPDLPLEFLLNMGFLGHFVSDISQPLHSTADYDGYGTGHGGIHLYYEEWVVDFIPGNLSDKIVELAQNQMIGNASETSYLREPTVFGKIRALSLLSESDKKLILDQDPLENPSTAKDERGLTLPAKRKWASLAVPIYEPLILKEMARSAVLLSNLWTMAYDELGDPDFSKLNPPHLPLIFDFVHPDYF